MKLRIPYAAAAVTVALGIAGPAAAQGQPITEFPPAPTPASGVCEVASAPGTNDLFVEQYVAGEIGRLNTSTGLTTEIPLEPGSVPGGFWTGTDGAVWFTEEAGNTIDRLDPSDNSIQRFTIPWSNALSTPVLSYGTALSDDITQGSDGKMYFDSGGNYSIGSYDPATHQFVDYPIPSAIVGPVDAPQMILKPGPNGTIIFNLPVENEIVSFDLTTHQFTAYHVPTLLSVPTGVATGPDGNIWFTEALSQKVGKINPTTGTITEYSVAGLASGLGVPFNLLGAMAFGSDGQLYAVVDPASTPTAGDAIMQFDPATHHYSEFATPTPASSPCEIDADQPGVLYFGEFVANRVGELRY